MLGIQTSGMPLRQRVDLDDLAARTERYAGADLRDLFRRAGLFALRRSTESGSVTAENFEAALIESRASATPQMEREYEEMRAPLKQQGPLSQPIGFRPPGQSA